MGRMHNPKQLINKYSKYYTMAQNHDKVRASLLGGMNTDAPYPLSSFSIDTVIGEYFKKIENGNTERPTTLWFSGVSNTGKSMFIKAFCEKVVGKDGYLVVRDLEGLKALKSHQKALILDDCNLSKLTREDFLNLIELQDTSSRILYQQIQTSGIYKIFISNTRFESFVKKNYKLRLYSEHKYEAEESDLTPFFSRVISHHVKKPLFKVKVQTESKMSINFEKKTTITTTSEELLPPEGEGPLHA